MKKTILFFLAVFSVIFAVELNKGWKVTVNKVGEPSGTEGVEQVQIDVFNEKGEKAYSISKSIPNEMPYPAASVFEAGELMVVYSYNGTIEFYDPSGKLINKITANPNSKSDYERVIKFKTLFDKSALLMSEQNQPNTRLVVVSSEGEIELEKNIEGNHATGVEISNKGNFIAAGTYSWIDTNYSEQTIFINSNGDITGKVSLSFSKGIFNSTEKIFLGYTNSNFFLVDIPELKLKWSYEFPSDNTLLDAAIVENNNIILSADLPVLKNGRWLYSNLILNIFNIEGKSIKKKKLDSIEVESAKIIYSNNQLSLNLDGSLINLN